MVSSSRFSRALVERDLGLTFQHIEIVLQIEDLLLTAVAALMACNALVVTL